MRAASACFIRMPALQYAFRHFHSQVLAERSRSDKQQRRMSPLGPSEPNASARSVEQVARSSGNVRQFNHLANEIAGHKAERRPGAGEEWLAATKNDGAEVKSILINKTKCG